MRWTVSGWRPCRQLISSNNVSTLIVSNWPLSVVPAKTDSKPLPLTTAPLRAAFRLLPDPVAFRLGTHLAARPANRTLGERDRKLLSASTRFRFGPDNGLVGYTRGTGPLIVFAHGWGGRATQMAMLANHMAERGFRSVIFDATGHGESRAGRISFRQLGHDLAALLEHLDAPLHSLVMHSASGLATMAARRRLGIQARRYVCISAPFYPYPPLDALRKHLGVSESVIELCKQFYAEQLDGTWESLRDGEAYYHDEESRLLLVYDTDDENVRHADGESIRSRWAGAELFETHELGHHKILWDPKVIKATAEFLAAD